METSGVTELARGNSLPDSPSAWAWAATALACYLVVRFSLVYAANRRAGVLRPARRVWEDMRDRPSRERRQWSTFHYLAGRCVLLAGMLLLLPAALIPERSWRIAILAVGAPLVVAAVAYADHRTSYRRKVPISRQPRTGLPRAH
ncbi:hypothetical protein [Streptomyces sp. NPDC049040]|uniref:hypothetical protein n=1 Tax=Streptomyces sp. NPDC049040 TaxID=3365593 RepID=UPI0037144E71